MTAISRSPSRRLPREGELFDERYRVTSLPALGDGTAVIEATDIGFNANVDIKVLLPASSGDPAAVTRFLEAGKASFKIRSEHAVRSLDMGVAGGLPYLVMDHIDGKNLDTMVREGPPLPAARAVDLFLQACEAIAEAHALGIVHGNLKLASLFLTTRVDGSPCVKVLDFGLHSRVANLHADLRALEALLDALVGRTASRHALGLDGDHASVAELARAVAPYGTSLARTSAESIRQIVERAARRRSAGGVWTESLETAPPVGERRKGWRMVMPLFLGAVLALATGSVAFGETAYQRTKELAPPFGEAAEAAAAFPIVDVTPPVLASSYGSSREARRSAASFAVQAGAMPLPIAEEDDGAGVYDAP